MSRTFVHLKNQLSDLLNAIRTPDLKLLFSGREEHSISSLALYGSVQQLGYNLSTVQARPENEYLARMISNGLSFEEIIEQIIPRKNSKWFTAGKTIIESIASNEHL